MRALVYAMSPSGFAVRRVGNPRAPEGRRGVSRRAFLRATSQVPECCLRPMSHPPAGRLRRDQAIRLTIIIWATASGRRGLTFRGPSATSADTRPSSGKNASGPGGPPSLTAVR